MTATDINLICIYRENVPENKSFRFIQLPFNFIDEL